MPKRLTIEYVKEFVRDKTNGECEVLSTEYVNSDTPLQVKCGCGEKFNRTFHKMRDREIMCVSCSKKRMSEKFRADVNDIISKINASGCEYVSGEYVNGTSLLTIRCRCGNLFKKSYAKFASGQDRCPKCGNESLRQAKTKYSVEDVKEKLSEKGFTMIDDKEYVDCVKPFRCICERGHEVEIKFMYFLKGHSGCKRCANIKQGGSNHWMYKNGVSDVEEALRKSIYSWKKDVRELYGGKCAVTGFKSNVIVHHLVDFYTLLEEASKELNIPVYTHIGDYEKYEDFISLKSRILEKHTADIGIPVTRKVHVRFHNEHEGERTTPEMFDEFLKKNYNTSLEAIQRKMKNEQRK